MIVCMNCSVEPLTNPKAKFCSDKCKKQWQRKNRDKTQSGQEPGQSEQGSTNTVTGAVRTYKNSVLCVPINKPEGSTKQGSTLKQPSPLETVDSFASDGVVFPTHKRGKDIKCFEDLPPDVQQTIDIMSTTDGKLDKTIKANRTAIAINYQHSTKPLLAKIYAGVDTTSTRV